MRAGCRIASLIPRGSIVESETRVGDEIRLLVRAEARVVACPLCASTSRRIHSRYVRRVSDLPCSGRLVRLHIITRRFCCEQPRCLRPIFAERFDEAVLPRPRRGRSVRRGCRPRAGQEVAIYDPAAFRAAIDEDVTDDDDFVGPEEERPAPVPPLRSTEEEIRARVVNRILNDPRAAMRPLLFGDDAIAERVLAAAAAMQHFAPVTGLVHRAVVQSARTSRPIRFPPILMVSPPGLGKTYYCRRIAEALGTTCVLIAINGTSDRGQLGGLSPLWRGAKLAKGLLVDSVSASPLFLLDEIDKPPTINEGERTLDVLLSALEPENARTFRDEYFDATVNLASALWIASANDVGLMAAPLLDRMLVVEVPRPTRAQARLIAESISRDVLAEAMMIGIQPDALEPLLDLSPRRIRRVVELACGFAIGADRHAIAPEDARQALTLVEQRHRKVKMGFTASMP